MKNLATGAMNIPKEKYRVMLFNACIQMLAL